MNNKMGWHWGRQTGDEEEYINNLTPRTRALHLSEEEVKLTSFHVPAELDEM